ncbi:NAD(P)H-dependent 2-cyclohexen-1-one reductase [hydrothermal vent metagenome]|uniref:NAD(P)H-dependent 2-cyclohexen-1-one reductase n=1 Tax=hydrothermal vent metagenome TaxID=652676 RepID=A0A3B0XZI2_9ZZZZ
MAPLTRNRAAQGNIPQAINIKYYEQRSSAGLIITEGSQISPQGAGYPNTPGIYNSAQIDAWKKITDSVHKKACRIFLQLWHVGRISHPSFQPNGSLPVAPSAIRPAGEASTYDGNKRFVKPHALSLDEIPDVIDQFSKAAKNALKAGFDGVEIHAAHGYLLDEFIRDGSNKRTDKYGGSLENRTRLLVEVVEVVSKVWGEDRVAVRLSPLEPYGSMYDSNPEATFTHVIKKLNKFNLAYLHIRENTIEEVEDSDQYFDLKKLRQLFSGTYMVNGSYDLNRANASIMANESDLVAFGQLFIANPDLPVRFQKNAALNRPDPSTYYGGGERGYTDYPFLK